MTTTRVTHATPAALFAHSPSRYWEDDSKVPPSSRKSCKDIALQLVDNEPGKNINVCIFMTFLSKEFWMYVEFFLGYIRRW